MAEVQPQPPARTRKKPTTIATTPFRHHPRIPRQKPFRFMDLAPELRNNIYTLALQQSTDKPLQLIEMPKVALSLAQVSRAVRAESLGIFYSENTFALLFSYFSPYIGGPQGWAYWRGIVRANVKRMSRWASTWGELAAPHLRSLSILRYEHARWIKVSIDLTDPLTPVSLDADVEGGKLDDDKARMIKAEFNSLVLRVLSPQGELELTAERLCILVAAFMLPSKDNLLVGAEQRSRMIEQIGSNAEQRELLANSMYQRKVTND